MAKNIEDRWTTATSIAAAAVGFAALVGWLIERHMAGNGNNSMEREAGGGGIKRKNRLRVGASKYETDVAPQFCAHEFYDP
jgi:hypothetical protein